MTQNLVTALRSRRLVALVMATMVAVFPVGAPLSAQVAQATSQLGPKSLHIDILEGEGASNNIRQRDAREPVVQVTDENHKPVGGVAVVFLINGGSTGGTASFAGAQSFTVTTGADGIAKTQGLVVGQAPGSFTISVAASLGPLSAQAILHQSNVITALNSAHAASHSGTMAQVAGHVGRTVLLTAVGARVATVVVVGVIALVQSTKAGTTVAVGAGTVGP